MNPREEIERARALLKAAQAETDRNKCQQFTNRAICVVCEVRLEMLRIENELAAIEGEANALQAQLHAMQHAKGSA